MQIQHNKETKQLAKKELHDQIIGLKRNGMSSRKIAALLDVSKSAVNDIYNRWLAKGYSNSKPRVLIFDVETSPSIIATFGRWNQNIGHDNVIKEGGWLISACWKWLGEDTVHSAVVSPEEAILQWDARVCQELWHAFEQSDIVVAHFGKGFDFKVFKTRLALNNIPNHKVVRYCDTKAIASSMKFNSNKLDSLADYFGFERKKDAGGIQTWIACSNGDQKALDHMLEYNKHDVVLLEQIYLKLRQYDPQMPNLGMYYNDGQVHCPCCGSVHLEATGNTLQQNLAEYSEVQCLECSYRSRVRTNLASKQKRSLQLSKT